MFSSRLMKAECILTQRLMQLVLMGMLEDKEVISWGVCGDPEGKLVGFCGFSVNQLDCLSFYIQPLEHNISKQTLRD